MPIADVDLRVIRLSISQTFNFSLRQILASSSQGDSDKQTMSENIETHRELLQQRDKEIVQLERELLERDTECHSTENYFQYFYTQVRRQARPLPEVGPKEWLGGFAPRIQEEIESDLQEAMNRDREWLEIEKKKHEELDQKLSRSRRRTHRYISKIEDKMERFQEELDEIKGRTSPVNLQFNTLLQVKRVLSWESGEIRGLLRDLKKQRRDIDEKVVCLERKLRKYMS